MHPFKTAATAAFLAMACGAQASIVQFEAGLPLTESATEINRSLSLGLFDSTLGTLNGVALELLGSSTFSMVVST